MEWDSQGSGGNNDAAGAGQAICGTSVLVHKIRAPIVAGKASFLA
jgi:hypothetical protein